MVSQQKTALVFGATGLIGSFVVKQLLADDRYHCVRVFSRKPIESTHSKLEVIVNNLTDLSQIANQITGHELYSCLGTTIRTAGSQEAFRKVDFDLPVELAKIASKNGVLHYLVVSSLGAKTHTKNFYLRTKGEMELAVTRCSFARRTIVRPSMLLGPRMENRAGEKIGKVVMQLIRPLMLGKWKRYRAIQAEDVARAMIAIANDRNPKSIYESEELFRLAHRKLVVND